MIFIDRVDIAGADGAPAGSTGSSIIPVSRAAAYCRRVILPGYLRSKDAGPVRQLPTHTTMDDRR